jgi:alginate O-acetyltransferase complex protein AlgI
MSLFDILILILAALILRLILPGKWRFWGMLVVSIFAIYWLQPALSIRNMDFWFPTATLGVICLSWGLTAERKQCRIPHNAWAAGLSLGVVLLIGLSRTISLEGLITPTRPPQIHLIVSFLAVFSILTVLLARFTKPTSTAISLGVLVLLLLFLILKTPVLATYSSMGLRWLMDQNPNLAQPTDLSWLGFSYVAFRLMHTLIDRLNGRLKDIQLGEYLVYTLFFPAFVAGPLDRLERFRIDLRDPQPLNAAAILQSGKRLALGFFKKFILADSLALIALSGGNASQVQSTGWMWLLLIAFSFQIYLDFAGYTDIAIGMGNLLGFQLPENFNRPYLKPNITQFWNNWHMTLTQWFRSYFFFPLTRYLRGEENLPAPLVIFITQLCTMLAIGLWHGVTRNFLIWGAWHGIGLFLHNRWQSLVGPQMADLRSGKPFFNHLLGIGGALLTFLFVSLGWVWFALPRSSSALSAFEKLFGLG